MPTQLTETHQDLLRWIVTAVRRGALADPFTVTWMMRQGAIPGFRDSHPPISRDALDALEAAGFLRCRRVLATSGARTTEPSRTVALLPRALAAVDADFQAEALDAELHARCTPLSGDGPAAARAISLETIGELVGFWKPKDLREEKE